MAVEVEFSLHIFYPESNFRHNPLHDLESLWWVGVWFLLWHYKPSNLMDDTVQEHMKLVKKVGQTLFNNGADRDSRRRALMHSTIVADSDPASFAKIIQYFVVLLNKFRAQLITHYKNYKPKDPRDRSFFTPDVHGNCRVLLEKLMESLRN